MKKLKGWTIKFTHGSEGYCWQKSKTITIGIDNPNIIRLLLHEIAHIGNNPHGNKHNQKWLNDYMKLHNKYFRKTSISKSDKIIKKVWELNGKTST